MRISDWSADVCSSDLDCRVVDIALACDGLAASDQPSDLHERLFGVRPAHRSERLQDPRQCVEPGLSVRLHRLAIGPTDALAVTPPRRREEHVGDLRDGRVRLTVDIMPLGQRRSEEHTSELQSLMRISSAVFCLKKKNTN